MDAETLNVLDRMYDDIEKETSRYALSWLREFSHWYGASCMMAVEDKTRFAYCEIRPKYDSLKLYWYFTHGCLRASIYSSDLHVKLHHPEEFNHFQVLGRGEYVTGERAHRMAGKFDEIAHAMFPGIRQCSVFGPCFSVLHGSKIVYGICTPVGNRWLCDDCCDRFSLPTPHDEDEDGKNENGENSSAIVRASVRHSFVLAEREQRDPIRAERAKLSRGLRFDVLERDNFTCRGCGASPLDDSSIKLHVDHIHPVSCGGKTTLSNLQVLCSDCNLGKKAKITDKMDRRDTKAC